MIKDHKRIIYYKMITYYKRIKDYTYAWLSPLFDICSNVENISHIFCPNVAEA